MAVFCDSTTARAGSIVESSCYRYSNEAVKYGDIDLELKECYKLLVDYRHTTLVRHYMCTNVKTVLIISNPKHHCHIPAPNQLDTNTNEQ